MTDKTRESEFLKLIREHQRIIHKTCFMYCHNRADKEDMYQEIVLQLWKSYASFRGWSEFSTWMYRVALNTAISMTKRQNLFVETARKPVVPVIMEEADGMSEDIQLLYKAISHLNKVEKGIVLLWLEEKSYEEIGSIIGITTKNVSVKLVRIKSKLADIIKKIQ